MEAVEQQSESTPEFDRDRLLEWADASVAQSKLEKTRARLREWIKAAKAVPDPHEDLQAIKAAAETILLLDVPEQKQATDLKDHAEVSPAILRLLKREVQSARDQLRRRADRLAGQAARLDMEMPCEEFQMRFTDREAEAWNDTDEGRREEVRRRLTLLNQLNECETTEEIRSFCERYQEEHPDKPLSLATYYRWKKRLREEGITGLIPQW